MGNQTSREWETIFQAPRHVFNELEQRAQIAQNEIDLGRKLFLVSRRLIDISPRTIFLARVCGVVNEYRITESEDDAFRVISSASKSGTQTALGALELTLIIGFV